MRQLIIVTMCAAVCLMTGCGGGWRTPDGSGTIEATDVQVSAEVPGQLTNVLSQEGSAVAEGDTIALIDPTDYRLQLSAARAVLSQARAQLDLVVAGARDESIEQARSRVRQAQAMSDLADANYERASSLFQSGSTTQQQLDEASAARESANSVLMSAQEGLTILLRGNREQEIRAAQAQVDQAQAAVALATRAVENCSIVSPADGTVTTKISESGEMVGAGTPVAVVSKLDRVWLSIYLPEPRLAGVALGDTAYVTIDGDKNVYSGTVSFISPEAEFTPRDVQTPDQRAKLVYRVKIELDNPRGIFKPGMPADGYIGGRP
ncbi:MAG: efflux RND transporter periplasmic adaptor subunit [Candidatus Eisenbacteria bacterium]|nr:efflux RND transporter periplasmic adaptor subunit [Candidatus Eisenbacteria bacterium]